MPLATSDGPVPTVSASATSSADHLPRISQEKVLKGVFAVPNGSGPDRGISEHRPDPVTVLPGLKNNSLVSSPNGVTAAGTDGTRQRSCSKAGSAHSIGSSKGRPVDTGRFSSQEDRRQKTPVNDSLRNGHIKGLPSELANPPVTHKEAPQGEDLAAAAGHPAENVHAVPSTSANQSDSLDLTRNASDRFSSPATLSSSTSQNPSVAPFPRLTHRHTLQMPKASSTSSRRSREFSFNIGPLEDTISAPGRTSPTAADLPRNRRASLALVRKTTKTLPADAHLDEYPPDEDAVRWTEAIRQKRASKRRRKEEEDDDRVIVGTKVDQGHVNWVTAYNMLTGIRFTVSRTNAKMDRDLTEADFDARHKFSFDITGNELTPSAKYDFKFKDYSPWVFRHLRTIFGLDPADYLVSLTSKYILSELGSPGKSGSFFYFSRDYKYIIKTIHPAEHRLLRKILRQYYRHVLDNPHTLLSQFYGLHRVKIPYGRKIHFVVMNNLFPPHRDIHQMFDLKGSTIGRDFREEDLAKHPRATLKDLNWLRRNKHVELGPVKRESFIEQMKRDVSLLQRLKIMDYSMLIGIHDLGKGNEQNLRENMLKVFQPGGEKKEDDMTSTLTRTATRQDHARKARELRETLKREKPVPMGMVQTKMPDEMANKRRDRMFYSEDGGFQATHDNGEPGEVVYYLGIIDCLTHYGFIKHLEHFWKGLSYPKTQISPIPPDDYGDRFINFITGITMAGKEIEGKNTSDSAANAISAVDGPATHSLDAAVRSSSQSGRSARSPVEKTMDKALKQAEKSERKGADERAMPDRTLSTMRSTSAERPHGEITSTLPVVEEAGEAGSTGGRSATSLGGRVNAVSSDEKRVEMVNGDEQNAAMQQPNGVSHDSDANPTPNRILPDEPLTTRSPNLTDNGDGERSRVCGLEKAPPDPDLSAHTV